ncbi:MAG TPA: sigma-70 family RNA polymerase sigma factor [Thermomicrobiales bacterium]|nr:sigma-70 family RNA polymerase sigma factor [Thermomicrobiales bacterium]
MRDESNTSPPLTEWDDADLVRAMATGNTHAMAELYDRYSRPVFSFALRLLEDRHHAEELLQEVFFRAWRQGDKFSDRRGSFISWLLSITHNMAIDEIRKQNRRPKRVGSDDPVMLLNSLEDDAPAVEDQAVQATIHAQVRNAMDALPEPQRMAIELAYFQGMTQREIAEIQGEPLGTIKTRLRLGVRKLREHLADQGVENL